MSINLKKLLTRSKAGQNANRSRGGTAVIVLIMSVFGLFSLLPMVLSVNQAFKPLNEIFIYPPKLFVRNPTMNNFKILFGLMDSTWVPFSRYVLNTILLTLLGTAGNVLVCSAAAYPLAKIRAPGFGAFFKLITFSLMFSAVVGDVINYMTVSALGWLNSYASLLVPSFATSLGLFLMRQFMVQLPDALLEAAKIDGASEYRIFFRIVMPQVKPAWLTLAIFSFQGLWTVGNTPYIYKEQLKTLGYAFSQVSAGGIMRIGAGAAASLIMMIVPIAFFVLSQSQIMQTMAASGMKD